MMFGYLANYAEVGKDKNISAPRLIYLHNGRSNSIAGYNLIRQNS